MAVHPSSSAATAGLSSPPTRSQAGARRHAGTLYIYPGSPWQTAGIESLDAMLRDERLAIEEFASPLEAPNVMADWRRDYSTYRPHSALGILTPTEFAARKL